MPLLGDAPGLGDVPINVPRLTALSIRDARPRIPEYRHSCLCAKPSCLFLPNHNGLQGRWAHRLYACVPSAPVSEASHQKSSKK